MSATPPAISNSPAPVPAPKQERVKPQTDDGIGNSVTTPAEEAELIEVGKIKKGTIVEGQYKDYKFDGVTNSPLIFTLRSEPQTHSIARYRGEIYDSRGRKLKESVVVYPGRSREMVFTPPTTAQYIIRLRGQFGRCQYVVYFDRS